MAPYIIPSAQTMENDLALLPPSFVAGMVGIPDEEPCAHWLATYYPCAKITMDYVWTRIDDTTMLTPLWIVALMARLDGKAQKQTVAHVRHALVDVLTMERAQHAANEKVESIV